MFMRSSVHILQLYTFINIELSVGMIIHILALLVEVDDCV